MNTRLEINEIHSNMERLPSWEFSPDTLTKTYTFENFKQAIHFINLIADAAEDMDHHPDILIFGWNKVRITLSTHSAKGLTSYDFELSNTIENIFNNLK